MNYTDLEVYLTAGLPVVPVEGKNPGITTGWHTKRYSTEDLPRWKESGWGVGLLLGPISGYVDFDEDGPEATAAWSDLLATYGKPLASCDWKSAKGMHHCFRVSPDHFELLNKTVSKISSLEIRWARKEGAGLQSVIPPSPGKELVGCSVLEAPYLPLDFIHLLPVVEDKVHEHEDFEDDADDTRPGTRFDRAVRADWSVLTNMWVDKLDYKFVGPNMSGGDLYKHPNATQKQSLVIGNTFTPDGVPHIHAYSPNCNGLPERESVTPHTALAIMFFDGSIQEMARWINRGEIELPASDNNCCEFMDNFVMSEVKESLPSIPASKPILPKLGMPEPDHTIYDFVLGKYVQELIPYTEAYPPAILFQLLEVAGILAGRRVYFAHGDYQFRLNGGTIVIGESGISRKGTGLLYARVPFRDHEHEATIDTLISENTQVSGEGFIQAISNRDNHQLLIACEEFAGMLKSSKREGSNLSMIIRNALDCKSLGIDARKNAIATMHDAYASIIGHCTLDEFIANIAMDDINNGFLNRFQFTLSRQNSKIAFPETVPDGIKQPVRDAFAQLIKPQEFSPVVTLGFAKDARPVWEEFYYADNLDRSSLRESLAARAPAQVLRNASRVALLEGSTQVDARRLRIALAMLKYSQDCIDFIFGDYLNDDEEEILQFLMSDKNGKTWHDINEWVARWKKPKRQTKRIVTRLTEKGIVAIKTVKATDGAGRPAQRLLVCAGGK